MRMNPVEIGCLLQTELNYRDSIFNCDYKTPYINKGDPCKKTDAYYEGPILPASVFKKMHPAIEEMHFDFEHGNLREISMTFSDSLLIDSVKAFFKLPKDNRHLPEDVMQISYGENFTSLRKPVNPKYTIFLSVTGFEHMGSADVECK